MEVFMLTRTLLTALLLLVAVACGNDLPTQPTPPPGGGANIDGQYTLTFTAAPSCSLPEEAKRRTYTATVAEAPPGHVTVTLGGAVLLQQLEPGFDGTRSGDAVQFSIGSGNRRWVAERIDGKDVFFSGSATVTFAGGSATAPFNGGIWVSAAGNIFDWIADCTATDHMIEFVRR
jgi:hypothetical protein